MQPLAPSDPRTAGEFRLSARLGLGGMGQVFLGYSPAGRAVAVKICHPELAADPEFVERFAREVTAAQAVNGLYTAQVVGAGPYDRPPWMATAYVPGPSLTDYVYAYGPLPEPAAWRLAAGIAEALLAVHARGLVHRDLKPSNVLLAVDGPRVIDFGIASALEMTGLTAAGSVMGSPPYMSPEQATGQPTGPASDVFALGSTLAFAACGAPPFGDGDAPALLFRVAHMEPALDAVPQRLRGVVAACLAKDPAARPTLPRLLRACQDGAAAGGNSAASFWPPQMTAAIAQHQSSSVSTTPPNGTALSGRTGPSHQQGLSQWQGDPHPATVAASSGTSTPPSPFSRRRMLTGVGGLVVAAGLAVAGWELTRPGGSPAAAGTGTGGGTGTTSGDSPGTLAWSHTADAPVRTGATASVDGRFMYIGSDTGTVYALDAVSGRQAGTYKAGGAVRGVAMAGGTLLVGSADGKVHAFPVGNAGGDNGVTWPAPVVVGTAISGAPVYAGGGTVYAASVDGYVCAIDLKTGGRNWHTMTGKGAVVGTQAGIGPGGSSVVWVGSQDGTVYLIDDSPGSDSYGKVLHTFLAGGAISAGPLVKLGNAYFGTSKGVLYDLDSDPIGASLMSVNWTFDSHDGAFAGTPVLSGDAFFTATANGSVYQVQAGSDIGDQPGTALWTSHVGPLQSGPTFDNGTLYVGSGDGYLYAIDASQGKVTWTHKAGGAITSRIVARNSLVYFGSLDNHVYALHA